MFVAVCWTCNLWPFVKYMAGFGPGELVVVLVGFGLVIGSVPGVVGFGLWFVFGITSCYFVYNYGQL